MNRATLLAVVSVPICAFLACSGDPEVRKLEYLKSGNQYLEAKKFDEATVEFQNAIRQDPSFGEAHLALGRAYMESSQTRAAFPAFIRAAELLPDNVEAQLTAGHLLYKGGMFDEARRRARSVLQKDPGNIQALMLLGNTLAGMKDLDNAVDVIQRAVQIDPERAGIYTNLAIFALAKGDPTEAEAAFTKAVGVSKESVTALVGLGNFYRSIRRTADAERTLKRAYEKAPKDVGVNSALAGLYVEAGRPAEAEAHLTLVASLSPDSAPRFSLAAYYVAMGRTSDAIKILEQLASTDTDFAEATIRMGLIAYATRNPAEAHRRLDEVIAKRPRHGNALTLKARLLLAEHKADEALSRVQAALSFEPRLADAHLTLGRTYVALGKGEDARKALNTALEIEPTSLATMLELAELHLARRDIDSARNYADSAVSNHPDSLVARLLLVRILLVRGESSLGEQIKTLLAKFPNASSVYTATGAVALNKNDVTTARRSFERALELNANSIEAHSGLIAIDLANKQIPQARKRVDALLSRKHTTAEPYFLAAGVYGLLGERAKVEELLRRALEVDPTNPEVYGRLGELFASQGRIDDARREFQEFVRLQPGSVGATSILGALAYAANDRADAKRWWEQALKNDPNAAAAANNLAWLYADAGENLDLAMQLAQTAKAQFPEAAEIDDTIGWLHYKRGMSVIAAGIFERCVKKQPKNPLFHFHLGMADAHRGLDARARASLERALSLNENFDGAAEARKTLAKLVY